MYACDIRDVLKHVKEESLEILVDNAVRYIKRNTKYFSTCNWIAQELFFDVIPDELIGEIFNKKVFADDEDDIRLILNASNSESFDNLIRNSVAYAESYNRSKINEIAYKWIMPMIVSTFECSAFNRSSKVGAFIIISSTAISSDLEIPGNRFATRRFT